MQQLTPREIQGIFVIIGAGIVGFFLSLAWGKATRTRMTSGTVKLLGAVFAGITVFGIIMVFVFKYSK